MTAVVTNEDHWRVPVNSDEKVLERKVADFDSRERLADALQPLVNNNRMRAYARSLRVSSNTVAKWLACESFPSGSNVSKVAHSLGMSLDEFNARIIQGRQTSHMDPADQAISIICSLPPLALARVLRAMADRVELYDNPELEGAPLKAKGKRQGNVIT